MSRRSRFVTDYEVRLTPIQAAFEAWLFENHYRPGMDSSAAGMDAADLVEDFLDETDEDIGKKRQKQLEEHADAIGLVIHNAGVGYLKKPRNMEEEADADTGGDDLEDDD